MTIVMVILVVLLTMAYFHLKCNLLSSLAMLIHVILSTIISLSFYELLAGLFVNRGYVAPWAQSGCFLLSFILCFAMLRALGDLLVGGNKVNLGEPLKICVGVICGALSGLLICGNLLIAIGLSPIQHKVFYSRFNPEKSISLSQPVVSFLNTDEMTAGLYGMVSRGSLSGKNSFSVLHADYLSQIHLNRLKVKDDVLAITSKKSLELPGGKAAKMAVRTRTVGENRKVTVVRMGLVAKNIQDGGAGHPAKSGLIAFIPAQIRLICKNKNAEAASDPKNISKGDATAKYPIGIMLGDTFKELSLDQRMPLETMKVDGKKTLWLDVVFEVPSDQQAVFLQFKQNAIVQLPKAVESSDLVEDTLNGKIPDETESETAEN